MSMNWLAAIHSSFPATKATGADKTSDETTDYNCIAYAAGEEDRWWCPHPAYYWPPDAPRDAQFDSLVAAYKSVGFVQCDNDLAEEGFIKIALYESAAGTWTHAAIQKDDGSWSSKLGSWIDIKHDLPTDLQGAAYGRVKSFMKKPKPQNIKSKP